MTVNGDVIKKSIEFYGTEIQSTVCMEECSELVQAISKELRGKSDTNHLAEEMADVLICITMLKQMYSISDEDIQDWITVKQNRILDRMAKNIA